MSNFFQKGQMMVFEIFIFIKRKKGNCKLLFALMQAHHTEKLKELVYHPPNIVRC